MTIARRAFLRTGGGALLAAMGGIAPSFASIMAATTGARRLSLSNLHTGEKVKLDYWIDGRYEPAALAEANRVLRDYRTGEVHPIEPRLFDLLHALQQNLESNAAYEVISGYRSPQTNAALHARSSGVASNSLHMQGMAMDVRLPDRALAKLHDAALALGQGGVGFYPTSDFVHVDVGRVRRWNGV
jgi:uncharacterized protein YcbK (DUF882 family)